MKGIVVTSVALCIARLALPAAAGVIITQQDTHPDGKGGTKTEAHTVMIEGNKQKSINGPNAMIIDLDQGKMVVLDGSRKTATKMPLTREGPAGAMMAAMASSMAASFQSTGAHKTVAGHSCEEYSSAGAKGGMGGEYTAISCFSKEAPGASEVAAFYKNMIEKLGTKPAGGSFPEGVVLSQEMTTKPSMPSMPGMPPEIAKKMADQMAAQGPQVFRTQVTDIKTATLPPDTFAIPAGYTKGSYGPGSGDTRGTKGGRRAPE